jgi:hypothetical protein
MIARLAHGRTAAARRGISRGLPTLRQEILEIASIRGSKTFAEAVDTFFASLLPLRRPPHGAGHRPTKRRSTSAS